MLVISNGAVKSGSTWLFNILTSLKDFAWPEPSVLTKRNSKHPTIAEPLLEDYLSDHDFSDRDEISKNHLGKPEHRALLLSREDVRVVCMTRESRDVIVSAYYHGLLADKIKGSFADYYWSDGRVLVPELKRYEETWRQSHPRLIATSFESLKSDFHGEVARLAQFFALAVDHDTVEGIYRETSLGSLREKYQDSSAHHREDGEFFRKGEIGDWRNHFDDRMLADHDQISRVGISPLDRHLLATRAKRKLRRMLA